MPKINIESVPYVSIFEMRKAGLLQEGIRFMLSWRDDSMRLSVSMRNSYVLVEYGDVAQPVSLAGLSCHFGGLRWYFVCPGITGGVGCGRQVAKLYLVNSQLACRSCQNLLYPLQRVSKRGKWLRLYKAMQAMNWHRKILNERTSFWKGRLTKRQANRLKKLMHYNNQL